MGSRTVSASSASDPRRVQGANPMTTDNTPSPEQVCDEILSHVDTGKCDAMAIQVIIRNAMNRAAGMSPDYHECSGTMEVDKATMEALAGTSDAICMRAIGEVLGVRPGETNMEALRRVQSAHATEIAALRQQVADLTKQAETLHDRARLNSEFHRNELDRKDAEIASLRAELERARANANGVAINQLTAVKRFCGNPGPNWLVENHREDIRREVSRRIAVLSEKPPAPPEPAAKVEPCRYQTRYADRVHGCQKPSGHDGEHETCWPSGGENFVLTDADKAPQPPAAKVEPERCPIEWMGIDKRMHQCLMPAGHATPHLRADGVPPAPQPSDGDEVLRVLSEIRDERRRQEAKWG